MTGRRVLDGLIALVCVIWFVSSVASCAEAVQKSYILRDGVPGAAMVSRMRVDRTRRGPNKYWVTYTYEADGPRHVETEVDESCYHTLHPRKEVAISIDRDQPQHAVLACDSGYRQCLIAFYDGAVALVVGGSALALALSRD